MRAKNLVTIGLLLFVAATILVLGVKSLRQNPQATEDALLPLSDGVIAYYFHSNTRCPTCRAIESQSHETVQSEFASRLQNGEVVWKVLNYEQPAVTELAKKFEIQMPVVVLARTEGGQIEDWKRLDRVWALVGDKPAFVEYVRDEISQMLETTDEQPFAAPSSAAPEIPAPNVDSRDIPVPTASADVPVPQ